MSRLRLPFRERFGGAALVTGASAGIGAAFARALAARGMDVVLVARREPPLRALAADLEREHGVRAVVVTHDLVASGAAPALREAVRAAGVEVGLLVNNAGFGSYGAFVDDDPAQAARMVDLNCRVPVELCHAFLPAMKARGRGGIVFVASTGSFQPAPFFAVYGATKAFDLMLAEALWAELRPLGIDVLGLAPGYTRTEFHDVAAVPDLSILGSPARAADVVELGLRALGRRPSVVHGWLNWLVTWLVRFLPRRAVVALAHRACAPRRGTTRGA